MSVIHYIQIPESTLNKKSLSLAYHDIRRLVSMNKLKTGHIKLSKNPENLATKIHGGGFKTSHLVGKLL